MRIRFQNIFFYAFLIFFSSALNAQNAKSDTLKCYYLNHKIEEENNHVVWIKYNNDLKSICLKNIENSNNSFQKTFLKYYSIALLNQGAYYNYTDQYRKAIILYKQSFAVAKNIKFYEQCASNLQNIGTAFDYLGKSDSSFVYFTKALNYANLSKNKSNIAYVLTDLGYVNNLRGNTTVAIENNLKALIIFEEIKDLEGVERTYLALGRIFENQKEFEKAITYYQKGLKIATAKNLEIRQGIYLNSLANAHFQLTKFANSQNYAKQALTIATKNNFVTLKAMSLKHLGDIKLKENKIDQAKKYFIASAEIFKTLQVDNNYCRLLIDLGEISKRKNNLNTALAIAKKAFAISKKSNYPSEMKGAAELLAEIYQLKKKFREAFEFQYFAKKIGDSIFYDETKNIALKSEFKYENEKKEVQIKVLSQQKKIANLESERQKVIVLFLAIAILSLVITSYFVFNRYKIKKQNELLKSEIAKNQAEKKSTESELKALKSQMNPHFIFNALSSIQDQFMFGDKVIANEQMGNFTYLTRQILNVSGKKQILIATEIDILTKYLELEKMRFKTDFEYSVTTSKIIDEDYHEIPPMLIQPFVENSIKHGLLHKSGSKKVSIHFALDESEDFIVCTVIDNGIGRKKSAEIKLKNATNHESFSTESIEQRLGIWNTTITNSVIYEDIITDENEVVGTKVTLKIELH
jgi:tetratricopeptide (TPR) repeat protein